MSNLDLFDDQYRLLVKDSRAFLLGIWDNLNEPCSHCKAGSGEKCQTSGGWKRRHHAVRYKAIWNTTLRALAERVIAKPSMLKDEVRCCWFDNGQQCEGIAKTVGGEAATTKGTLNGVDCNRRIKVYLCSECGRSFYAVVKTRESDK
jgi:hypothetical protein